MFGNQLSKLFDRSRAQRSSFHQTLRQKTLSVKSSSDDDTESEEGDTESEEGDTESEGGDTESLSDGQPEVNVIVLSDSEDEARRGTIGLDDRRTRSPIAAEKDQTTTRLTNLDLKPTGKLNEKASTKSTRDQIVSAPRAIETKHRPVQCPKNANTARPNRVSQHGSEKTAEDVASEEWLQERLARAEKDKKRTVFLSGPPTPVPREKPQRRYVSFSAFGGGSFNVPIRASKEQKKNDLDLRHITETGKALSQYLEKDPENERTLHENDEYKRCKEKLDRGETITTAERDRMRSIKTNVEKREYSLQRKRLLQKESTVSRAKKRKVEVKTPRNTKAPEKPVDIRENEENKRTEALKKALEAFHSSPEAPKETGSSLALDCSPTIKDSLGPGKEQYGKEETGVSSQNDEYVISSRNLATQEPRKTIAGKGLIKDIVKEVQPEESPEPMISDESSEEEDEEEDEEIQYEPFWKYDVYRREFGGHDNCDPVLLGTYLNRRKAEGLVRGEISNIQASLNELCQFEFSCKFEQNSIRQQALTFSSGRSVEIFIEKDVAPEGTTSKRPKKARLPTKHYLVIEETTDMEPGDDLFETAKSKTTRIVEKESYIFWQDANRRANKLFIARQTSQFEGDERFDIGITGSIDTEGRRYLHELEDGERLFDKTTEVLPVGNDGKKFKTRIWVQEQLLRGPRN